MLSPFDVYMLKHFEDHTMLEWVAISVGLTIAVLILIAVIALIEHNLENKGE